MKYDFTTVIDRTGRDSIAADVIPFEGLSVDEGFDPIPMWIADMSFPVAPAVISAIKSRLDFPSFGYFPLSREYFDSIIGWQRRRNGVEGLLPEHIGYENGVLGGVTKPVSGAWTTRTWTESSGSITSTLPSSAPRTTPAAECGSAGR